MNYQKLFQTESLEALQGMRPYIAANIQRYAEAGNEIGTATYMKVLAELQKAITEKSAHAPAPEQEAD